jgi:hypothetical protein
MAKHEFENIGFPTDHAVIVETWSGKIARYEKSWHCWRFIAEAGYKWRTHVNDYDSYGEMPVGSVVVCLPFMRGVYRKNSNHFWERVAW